MFIADVKTTVLTENRDVATPNPPNPPALLPKLPDPLLAFDLT